MSETATETDPNNIDFELGSVELEPSFGLDEGQVTEDLPEAEFQFKSLEEVINARGGDGKEWVRLAESSGSEYLNDSTKESYYKDAEGKKNVVLSRERDGEVLDDLFTQGFSIREKSVGGQVTRETYFADGNGHLSYAIDVLSLDEEVVLNTEDAGSSIDGVPEVTEDGESVSSDEISSFGIVSAMETQVVYTTAVSARQLMTPALESNSIQAIGNEKIEEEVRGELLEQDLTEQTLLPGLKTVVSIEQSQLVETSRLNLKVVSAEVGPRQVAPEIEQIEAPIIIPINEKAEIAVSDIQEFGIALVQEDTETEKVVSKVTFDTAVLAEVRPEVSSEIVGEETGKVTFPAGEVFKTTENEEGITLVDINDSIAETSPAKVTFALEVFADVGQEIVSETGNLALEKVTFPVREVNEISSAKVTLAPIEVQGSVELAAEVEVSTVRVTGEANDYQATIISETRAETIEVVTDEAETEQVDAVAEKFLTVVDAESEIDKQIIAPEVETVIVDRMVVINERTERLVVEPQEVKVNLQVEAPVESERVVLFRRAESAELVSESNENLSVEQVAVEPILRTEQLSNNQSPIQNDSQATVEDEELTPEPVAINLAA